MTISKTKKKFCFEVITPERTYYVRAEDEKKMKEWIDAVLTVSRIHNIRDKFQGVDYHLSYKCNHQLIHLGKKLISSVTRVTGITKAMILAAAGKLKLSKKTNINNFQINVDNDLLGNAVTNVVKNILIYVDDPYNEIKREVINSSIDKFIKACNDMLIHGTDTQNASALEANIRNLVEDSQKVKEVPCPSPKTEILHFVKSLADIIQLYAESSNNEQRALRSSLLTECGTSFVKVSGEVFKLIQDNTYALPFIERVQIIPAILKDVHMSVKSATMFTVAQTYATNACKTLFFILNQIREVIIASFPRSNAEHDYDPVGPEDSQFKLQSEDEFTNVLKEQGHSEMPKYRPLPPIPKGNKALDSLKGERQTQSQPNTIILGRRNTGKEEPKSPRSNQAPIPINNTNDLTQFEVQSLEDNILFELDNLLAEQESVNHSSSPITIKSTEVGISASPISVTPSFGYNTPTLSSSPMTKSPLAVMSSTPILSSTPVSTDDAIFELDALLQSCSSVNNNENV